MDMSHIPDDLKKREIFRYEQQAWHFLLVYIALWAGLITITVKALETNRLTRDFVDHLFSFEGLIPSLQGILPWMLAVLIIYSIWTLRSAMLDGFISVKDASIDTVLTLKSTQALRGIRWGFITSILLTAMCLYISLFTISRSEELLAALSAISLPLIMVVLFLITPIIENIIHLKEYTNVTGILVKLEGALSLYLFICYFFPKAIAFLFSMNEVVTLLTWGVFLAVLVSNLYFFIQKLNLAIED